MPRVPWPLQILLGTLALLGALLASGHAVIYKREARSAALWVIVVWLLPFLGAFLYVVFGVNRVRREAIALRRGMVRHRTSPEGIPCEGEGSFLPKDSLHLHSLAQLGCRVTDRRLLPGNVIEPLIDGTEAYPAMIQAIDNATDSVGFATYIFAPLGIGDRFIPAF